MFLLAAVLTAADNAAAAVATIVGWSVKTKGGGEGSSR